MKDLDLNDEVIRDFGLNAKGELSVITEDMDAAQAYCKDIPEVKNIYFYDSVVKCDRCQTLVDIDNTELDEGDNVCNNCL